MASVQAFLLVRELFLHRLLVEKCGSNLRNLIAHELLDVDQCIGAQSTYSWWSPCISWCCPYSRSRRVRSTTPTGARLAANPQRFARGKLIAAGGRNHVRRESGGVVLGYLAGDRVAAG